MKLRCVICGGLQISCLKSEYGETIMLKNYIKIALRAILRNKVYSLINISGLAIGMAGALLILLWVKYELDYDHFHENLDQIYRVVVEHDGFRTPTTPGPMAAFLQAEIPEIEIATRFKHDRTVLKYGDKSFRFDGLNAEPSFMDVFTFPQIKGDVKTGLDDVQSIVLTESAAKKLFADEEPVGKIVQLSNRWTAKIAAVIKDVPANSSPPLRFEYLAPFKTYYFWREPDSWNASSDYNTWALLTENSNIEAVNEKIDALIKRHNPDPNLRIFLQPFREIHLQADTHRWDGPHGDMQYVIIFSLLAFIILAIACINFMNLSTARATMRAKEVGVRKVVGADRSQLMKQFFSESFVFALMALPVSLLIVELALPAFVRLTGNHLSFDFRELWTLVTVAGIFIFTGLVSGLYPAFFLSSFKPLSIIKQGYLFNSGAQGHGGNLSIRKFLVIFQFALSVMVISATLIIYQQLSFIRNENLGFDQENLLYVSLSNNYPAEAYRALKNELANMSGIAAVGGSDQLPTDTDFIPAVKWMVQGEQKSGGFTAFMVDEDFIDVYRIPVVQGRAFSKEIVTDKTEAFVVNQAALKALGLKEPLGAQIEVYNRKGRIIGVVKDFHFETFREAIEPLFMMPAEQCIIMNIRLQPENITETIDRIKQAVAKHYPGSPFIYEFLDNEIDHLYRTDRRMGQIFISFSALAILLSCMGLYGLISFVAERKTKEIGIRKVLGASVSGIVHMLSREFAKWTFIAIIIAWPLAWYAMHRWLQNFAYRVEISLWVFLLAGGITVLLAILTVSWQAIRAALANPVESLRYE